MFLVAAFPCPSLLQQTHSDHRSESLKTFQAFSLFSLTSRQFRDGFLNDPLIIGSRVSLFFFKLVCWLSCFLSSLSPLYSIFKGAFSAPLPTSLSSFQNGFLIRLFVLIKWNVAKSLRAFFSLVFFIFFTFLFRKLLSIS